MIPLTTTHCLEADGIDVFYREAGAPGAPVILLLHGFPSSSFQFRELIPRLATAYRVIAPDLPGFGFTNVPEERRYTYTFDALAATILAFTTPSSLTATCCMSSIMVRPQASGWRWPIPNGLWRLCRRTVMPMRRDWVTHGLRSNATGNIHQLKTGRPSAWHLILPGCVPSSWMVCAIPSRSTQWATRWMLP